MDPGRIAIEEISMPTSAAIVGFRLIYRMSNWTRINLWFTCAIRESSSRVMTKIGGLWVSQRLEPEQRASRA